MREPMISRREFIVASLWMGGWLLAKPSAALCSRDGAGWRPAYDRLEKEGLLEKRVEQAYSILENCELCPRQCGVNRIRGERGFCRAPAQPVIHSAQPHFGEEIPLVGQNGSGTIFFSHCNLRCVFCQNWPISHEGRGRQLDETVLAEMMLTLQGIGCHNINLVTPTHMMPNILKGIRLALRQGLCLPMVYNTSGYERPEIVKLLDGIVDIYMPDLKFMDAEQADRYSPGALDYPAMTQQAILEMQRQVGGLEIDPRGIARRGLMIRHLVMPNRVAGTEKFAKWVAENLPRSTYLNIMPQYRVEYRAFEYPEIARGITVEEFLEAIAWAEQAGLTNLDAKSVEVRDFFRRRSRS